LAEQFLQSRYSRQSFVNADGLYITGQRFEICIGPRCGQAQSPFEEGWQCGGGLDNRTS
jgi:hypothetical protein